MSKQEFNDLVLDCVFNNLKTLYVSFDTFQLIRQLLGDQSNSGGLRMTDNDGNDLCHIYPYDEDISEYLRSIAKRITKRQNQEFKQPNNHQQPYTFPGDIYGWNMNFNFTI